MASNGHIAQQLRLQNIFNQLAVIDEGQQVLDFLSQNAVDVVFDRNNPQYAAGNFTVTGIKGSRFLYGSCFIDCNSTLNDHNLLQAVIHESQHIKHHLNDLGNPGFWPSDEDHCLIRRVQEADAQATTTKIVYLLKEAGYPGPYQEVMNTIYAPLCDAFAAACQADPQALHNGAAKRAAFDCWFDNDGNIQHYDRNTVLHQKPFLQARLYENPHHTIRSGGIREKWLKKIGALSCVNYMDLPGYPKITSSCYRRNIKENIALFPPAPVPSS